MKKTGVREPTLFVLIDYDNIRSNVRLIREEDLGEWLMKYIRPLGKIAFSFLLVDANRVERSVKTLLSAAGFTIVDCPKSDVVVDGSTIREKDMVDTTAVELIHRVLRHSPEITTLVIASGDRDFSQALASWKNAGKRIVILGHRSVAREMRRIADEVVDLRPLPEQAIEGFRELLMEQTSAEAFENIRDPSIALVRDTCTSNITVAVLPRVRAGRQFLISYAFLWRGFRELTPQTNFWPDEAIQLLIAVLLQAIFIQKTDDQNPYYNYYVLDSDHPFVQYVLSKQEEHAVPAPQSL